MTSPTTFTIEEWLKMAEKIIQSASPRLDAELLLTHYLVKNRSYLRAFSDAIIYTDSVDNQERNSAKQINDNVQLNSAQFKQLSADLKQLSKGYPIAYLLGYQHFWDMKLRITEDTLIPRADTETLIEVVSTLFPENTTQDFIDLGTGSGAIAIALSRVFPNANITATDISEAALSIARENAQHWQTAPITFKKNNWLSGFSANSADVIVSNPPYIEENDKHLKKLIHEPISALTAPDNGLADIKIIISQSLKALKSGGYLLLEHGYDQGERVRECFNSQHWQCIETHRDLGENERVTVAQKSI